MAKLMAGLLWRFYSVGRVTVPGVEASGALMVLVWRSYSMLLTSPPLSRHGEPVTVISDALAL